MPKKQSKNKVRQNNQRKSKGRKMSSRRGNLKNKKNKSKLSYKKRPAKGGSNDHDLTTPEHWKHIFSEEFAKQYEETGFKYYLFDKFKKLPLDSLDSLERGIKENIFDCSALNLIRASIPLLLEEGMAVGADEGDTSENNLNPLVPGSLFCKLKEIGDSETNEQFRCTLESFIEWKTKKKEYTVDDYKYLEDLQTAFEAEKNRHEENSPGETEKLNLYNQFLEEINGAIKDAEEKKREERERIYKERKRQDRRAMIESGKSGLAGAYTR